MITQRSQTEARLTLNEADTVYASHTSVWEIVIKKALGKLSAPDDLEQALIATGFGQLPITLAHILAVGELPLDTHKDPFDRLLVVQAKVEGLTLITRDTHLGMYEWHGLKQKVVNSTRVMTVCGVILTE